MDILVGCEESGVVRSYARECGHNAFSNDLIPARDMSEYHLQMDVFDAIQSRKWDMIILHWPCTETCLSGNGTWAFTQDRIDRAIGARRLIELATSVCDKVCLEQPKTMIGAYIGPPSQMTNLKFFNEPETKSMWLWLYGLSPLVEQLPSLIVYPKVHYESPGVIGGLTRSQRRSTTRLGFAKAMIDQWSV